MNFNGTTGVCTGGPLWSLHCGIVTKMWLKIRIWFGLLSLIAGILLAGQARLTAGSCERWIVLGNSVRRVQYLLRDGGKLLRKKNWVGAVMKYEEAAGYCEENVGYHTIGRASALASFSYEKIGNDEKALRFAERAERLLTQVPKGDRKYRRSQIFLKDVRARIVRLRPLHPIVQGGLVPPPPFTGPMIPLAYRRGAARRVASRRVGPNLAGILRIESSPGRAAILFNGKRQGRTPVVLRGLGPGKYRLTIKKKAYRTQTRIVRLAPGAQLSLKFRLRRSARIHPPKSRETVSARRRSPPAKVSAKPKKRAARKKTPAAPPKPEVSKYGRLIVESIPPSMMVAVDGVLRGKSPLILDKVSPGLHRVEVGVGRQDGQTRNFKVEVRPGQTYRLHAAMPPQKGANLNEALFALDSGAGRWVEGDTRPPVLRVAFLEAGPVQAGRPITELIPLSELPEFMRRENLSLKVGLEIQSAKTLSGVKTREKSPPKKGKSPGRKVEKHVPAASPPEAEGPPLWKGRLPKLGMMGLGLLTLAGAFVGWRKRRRLAKAQAPDAEMGIDDLEGADSYDLETDEEFLPEAPDDELSVEGEAVGEGVPGAEVSEEPEGAPGEGILVWWEENAASYRWDSSADRYVPAEEDPPDDPAVR